MYPLDDKSPVDKGFLRKNLTEHKKATCAEFSIPFDGDFYDFTMIFSHLIHKQVCLDCRIGQSHGYNF